MNRALLLVPLLLVGSCDSVKASLFALGTIEREFQASIDPVEIPGFDVGELLAPANVERLVTALGYDAAALEEAGANFAHVQSVIQASRDLGDPLPDHDESIRALLSVLSSAHVDDRLSNAEKGRIVKIGLDALFVEPLDYSRLEASLRERAHSVPVEVEVTQRTETIDEVLRGKVELVTLLRSGWIASLRVTEIGLRTLLLEEQLRILAGLGLEGALQDTTRMNGCTALHQDRIEGLERIEIAVRSLDEDATWVGVIDADVEPDASRCAWMTGLRSTELVGVLAADQGLAIRVRVRAPLPREKSMLGGYLWFESTSVNIDAGEF